MNSKFIYYLAAFVGGSIGYYIPALWGGVGILSVSSLFFSTVGAIGGIILVWKLFNN